MQSVALVLLALLETITNGAHLHMTACQSNSKTRLLNAQKKESYGFINNVVGRRRGATTTTTGKVVTAKFDIQPADVAAGNAVYLLVG